MGFYIVVKIKFYLDRTYLKLTVWYVLYRTSQQAVVKLVHNIFKIYNKYHCDQVFRIATKVLPLFCCRKQKLQTWIVFSNVASGEIMVT